MSTKNVSIFLLAISLIAVISSAVIYATAGVDNFQEEGFITLLSIIYLLIIAVITFQIFRIRKKGETLSLLKSPATIWLLISLGLVFLAADEYYELHERFDFWIHDYFGIEETNLTDHLDDLFVAIYAFLGLGVLAIYQDELKRYKEVWRYFVIGFVLAFLMIIVDALTNGADLLVKAIGYQPGDPIEAWLKMGEDIFKIFSQAYFIIAFYAILQQAQQMTQWGKSA